MGLGPGVLIVTVIGSTYSGGKCAYYSGENTITRGMYHTIHVDNNRAFIMTSLNQCILGKDTL